MPANEVVATTNIVPTNIAATHVARLRKSSFVIVHSFVFAAVISGVPADSLSAALRIMISTAMIERGTKMRIVDEGASVRDERLEMRCF